MADVKFGLNQIQNPSPQWAKNIFRIVLYASTGMAIVLSTVDEIPDHVKVSILKYTAEGTALVHAFSKLFGIAVGGDPNINNGAK